MTYVLSMFNTGQVTLPKKWRDKNKSSKYIARPQGNKLILEPLENISLSDLAEKVEPFAESYEDSQGEIGVKFKKPIDAGVLAKYTEKIVA
jgi:bifunctional DNA-binding transcriptional regulator/antitoxin component of YhaV-PrlF toxin-antitoxin module